MRREDFPEIRLAQRILKKHSLIPPFDIRALLESYAIVYFKSIPISRVDGIAINIKVPGKKPIVIINQESQPTRQNFTMAHELGHLIIPWHTGIKIDSAAGTDDLFYAEYSYLNIEGEANRFAAELLMPENYIKSIVAQSNNLAIAHREICSRSGVSPQAAAIQMGNFLQSGIIYYAIRDNKIEYAGSSSNTYIPLLKKGQQLNKYLYSSADEHSFWSMGNTIVHWWRMPLQFTPVYDPEYINSQEIFEEISHKLNPDQGISKYKQSVYGIIGLINGRLKIEGNYNLDSILAACYQRFEDERHQGLVTHPKFKLFLQRRVEELLSKAKK
jgi:Zn-dependent peptidase ImmA (M78 family)